jgi:hypothetical protein
MGHSGAGGKLIHKKTRSKKSRDTVPLTIKDNRGKNAPIVAYKISCSKQKNPQVSKQIFTGL